MIITKKWSMPNKETFSIRPIRELIDKYREEGMVIVDPFARNSDIGTITNDLDPDTRAMYHKDATDFLRGLKDNIADMVLYDPPYSTRQVSESYKKLGGAVNMQTTQSSYWAMQKKEIARITKKGGVVITCAWNSGGIGAGLPISTASGFRDKYLDQLHSMEDNAGRIGLIEAVTPDISNPVWDVGTLLNLLPYEIEGCTLECYKLKHAWSVAYRNIDEIPICWSSERLLIDTLFSLITTLLKNGLYEYKTNSKNKVQNGG